MRILLFLALVYGLGTSCFIRRGHGVDPEEEDRPSDLSVVVQNDNYYDATIYAVTNNSRERLGVVRGLNTETFRFKWKADRLYFVIDLLAVGSYASEQMAVTPGDELELRVRPDLHRTRPNVR